MRLISGSYQDKSVMPAKHATRFVAHGENISPQFTWADFPSHVKSFALTIIDKHPRAGNWVHWIVINIPRKTTSLDENISVTGKMPHGSLELINTFGEKGYGGPQPPVGSGNHNYVATVYALDEEYLNLSGQVSEKKLLDSISAHILEKASLAGYFSR